MVTIGRIRLGREARRLPLGGRPIVSCRNGAMLSVVIFASLWTSTGAQQRPAEASIFRLVTFQTNGDLRLGATQGNGETDIVDIHNAVAALMAAQAPEVRNLAYIPADMKTLIEVGDTAVAALKTVYKTARSYKGSGKLVDPGGERRVFHPPTAVRLRARSPTRSRCTAWRATTDATGSRRLPPPDPRQPASRLRRPSRVPGAPSGVSLIRPSRPFSSSRSPGLPVPTMRS